MLKQSCDSTVIEVYLEKRPSLIIDHIDAVTPPIIQIGIGNDENLPISKGIIHSIIDYCQDIKAIILPKDIPSYLIGFLSPLMEVDAPHYYVENGQNGFDIGVYDLIPGNLPDEINLCHRFDTIQTPTPLSTQSVATPVNANRIVPSTLTGTFNLLSDDEPSPDGFNPISKIEDIPDGFNPIPDDDSLDDIVDGFHDMPLVEKRTMWSEDPIRMNRLSYLPIAAITGDTKFPEVLGGGNIR